MIALAWKEVRELGPAALLVLFATVIVASTDAAVKSGRGNSFPFCIPFVWIGTLLVAAAAGASVFARERPEHLRYLNSWPISRGRVAAVKVLVAAVLTVVATALMVAIAQSILALAGTSFWEEYGGVMSAKTVIAFSLVMLFVFCLTLSASALVRHPAGAMLLGPAVGLFVLYRYLVASFTVLAPRFGPWLGTAWPWPVPGKLELIALALAAIAAAAGVLGHVLAPVGERGLRLKRTVAAYAGLIVAAGIATIGYCAIAGAGPIGSGATAEIDPTGRHVLVAARHSSVPDAITGLWLLDPLTGNLDRISGGAISNVRLSPEGDRVFFRLGVLCGSGFHIVHSWDWVHDIREGPRGRLLPLRSQRWGDPFAPVKFSSPHGAYIALGERAFLYRDAGGWDTLAPPAPYSHYIAAGWTPDETALYWIITARELCGSMWGRDNAMRYGSAFPEWRPDADTLVLKTAAPSEETEAIWSLKGGRRVGRLSPDGRYLPLAARRPSGGVPGAQAPYERTTILDLETHRQVEIDGVVPDKGGWTASGRHLWCRTTGADAAGTPQPPGWVLVDAATGEKLNSLRATSDAGLRLCMSPDRTRMLVLARCLLNAPERRSHPSELALYVAAADGGGCRWLYRTNAPEPTIGLTHDGDAILTEADQDTGAFRVLRIDTETGAVTTLLERQQRR